MDVNGGKVEFYPAPLIHHLLKIKDPWMPLPSHGDDILQVGQGGLKLSYHSHVVEVPRFGEEENRFGPGILEDECGFNFPVVGLGPCYNNPDSLAGVKGDGPLGRVLHVNSSPVPFSNSQLLERGSKSSHPFIQLFLLHTDVSGQQSLFSGNTTGGVPDHLTN